MIALTKTDCEKKMYSYGNEAQADIVHSISSVSTKI